MLEIWRFFKDKLIFVESMWVSKGFCYKKSSWKFDTTIFCWPFFSELVEDIIIQININYKREINSVIIKKINNAWKLLIVTISKINHFILMSLTKVNIICGGKNFPMFNVNERPKVEGCEKARQGILHVACRWELKYKMLFRT